MSFESIELDFDDSEDKNSEENSDEKSISNDLISQGSKNHSQGSKCWDLVRRIYSGSLYKWRYQRCVAFCIKTYRRWSARCYPNIRYELIWSYQG